MGGVQATGARYAGWVAALIALSVAVAVVARVASTARSALLFTDGDSMLPLLVMRSLDAAQPQDWAMSSVLFLPELLVFGAVWMLRLGPDVTILVCGVLNLLALYGALRVAAGSRARARMPVAGALVAYLAFAVLAALDHTADRDSLELASLLATTTYYSATVVAAVLAIGLLRRIAEPTLRPAWTIAGLGLLAAAAVLSNPLFLLWATGPLVVLAVFCASRSRSQPLLIWAAVALVAGSGAGYLLRVPFAPFIANDGLDYIDVAGAGQSLVYYGRLVAEMWTSPLGAVSSILTLGLIVLAVLTGIRLRGTAAGLVAVAGWLVPAVVVVAAIVLGTHAARYLQPVVFAPVAALVVVPAAFPRTSGAVASRLGRHRTLAGVLTGAAVVASIALAIPALATPRADPDLDCVAEWVDASGRTGAGQYWTVRLPKAHVSDPRSLVQVDHELRPYWWLVNRDDARAGSVSFLVSGSASTPFALPGASVADADRIPCGRYTIFDFGGRELPLGIPRS